MSKQQVLHEALSKGWYDVVSASIGNGASPYHPRALSIVADLMDLGPSRERDKTVQAFLSMLKQESSRDMSDWIKRSPLWNEDPRLGNDAAEQRRVAHAFESFEHDHWYSEMVDVHELDSSLLMRNVQERANELRMLLSDVKQSTGTKVDEVSVNATIEAVDALTEEIDRVMKLLNNGKGNQQGRLADF